MQQVGPVTVGKLHVQQDHIAVASLHRRARIGQIGHANGLISARSEILADVQAGVVFVVND